MTILEVKNLSISFTQYSSMFKQRTVRTIEELYLDVAEGEILAVVGASGSGKSLLAHALLGILPDNARMSGSIWYRGERLDIKKLVRIRGREIALVPQSVASLNPLIRVGTQVRMAVRDGDPVTVQRKVFQRYHLPEDVERMYPFQLSGGMARKVLLATAVVSGARCIVADEPTVGIHIKDVKEVLQHFQELAEKGCAVILITHDIEAALKIANRVAVFYSGTVVEIASASDFVGAGEQLRHPYSRALWQALPQNTFMPIQGNEPAHDLLSQGCVFAPRCPLATPECKQIRPKVRTLRGGMVSCIHAS